MFEANDHGSFPYILLFVRRLTAVNELGGEASCKALGSSACVGTVSSLSRHVHCFGEEMVLRVQDFSVNDFFFFFF